MFCHIMNWNFGCVRHSEAGYSEPRSSLTMTPRQVHHGKSQKAWVGSKSLCRVGDEFYQVTSFWLFPRGEDGTALDGQDEQGEVVSNLTQRPLGCAGHVCAAAPARGHCLLAPGSKGLFQSRVVGRSWWTKDSERVAGAVLG